MTSTYTHQDVVEYKDYLIDIIDKIEENEGYFLNPVELKKYYTYTRIGFYFDLLSLVDEKVGLRNKSICDMASGGGVLSNMLHKYYDSKITSVDALDCGIGFGQMHTPDATWVNDNIFDHEGEFDLVFACEVLEHLVDPVAALNKLLGKVKTGGSLVVTVPDGRIDTLFAGEYFEDTQSYSGHINFWSMESFQLYFKDYKPDVTYLKGRGDDRANKICAIFQP